MRRSHVLRFEGTGLGGTSTAPVLLRMMDQQNQRSEGRSRGPTAPLRQHVERLTEKAVRGEAITPEEQRKLLLLGNLDLARSSRPTCRAQGIKGLQEIWAESSKPTQEGREEDALRRLGMDSSLVGRS